MMWTLIGLLLVMVALGNGSVPTDALAAEMRALTPAESEALRSGQKEREEAAAAWQRQVAEDAKQPEWLRIAENVVKVELAALLSPMSVVIDEMAKDHPDDQVVQTRAKWLKFFFMAVSSGPSATTFRDWFKEFISGLPVKIARGAAAQQLVANSGRSPAELLQDLQRQVSAGGQTNIKGQSSPVAVAALSASRSSEGSTASDRVSNTPSSQAAASGAGGAASTPAGRSSGGVGSGQMRSSYSPVSAAAAQGIVRTYGRIPGGLTLEGHVTGIPPLSALEYDRVLDMFLVNSTLLYAPPTTHLETRAILNALAKDEKLGVSLARRKVLFGGLPDQDPR